MHLAVIFAFFITGSLLTLCLLATAVPTAAVSFMTLRFVTIFLREQLVASLGMVMLLAFLGLVGLAR